MMASKTTHALLRKALLLWMFTFNISSCSGFSFLNNKVAPFPSSTRLSLSKHQIENQQVEERPKKKRKKLSKKQEYEERKQEWLSRYGSLEALQSTFGSTKGDLSPEQTRRLYHTLLPRSLLGLYEMGLMNPEELAPLAYEARIAAKQYARGRCVWYARVATQVFDQYRNLRDKGRLSKQSSMTWDEIWSKYEAQIVEEECNAALNSTASSSDGTHLSSSKPLKEKDLTMRIYLRILEKSTATNKAFDQMFLNNSTDTTTAKATQKKKTKGNSEMNQLQQMGQQLDKDVKTILLGPKDSAKALKKAAKLEIQQAKARIKEQEKEQKRQEKLEKSRQKELERQQRREEEMVEKEQKRAEKRLKQLRKKSKDEDSQVEESDTAALTSRDEEVQESKKTISQEKYGILRILAGNRKKFRRIKDEGELDNNKA